MLTELGTQFGSVLHQMLHFRWIRCRIPWGSSWLWKNNVFGQFWRNWGPNLGRFCTKCCVSGGSGAELREAHLDCEKTMCLDHFDGIGDPFWALTFKKPKEKSLFFGSSWWSWAQSWEALPIYTNSRFTALMRPASIVFPMGFPLELLLKFLLAYFSAISIGLCYWIFDRKCIVLWFSFHFLFVFIGPLDFYWFSNCF